ncbi:498_t:CDS:10, partial [Ambispora gerdemannii]
METNSAKVNAKNDIAASTSNISSSTTTNYKTNNVTTSKEPLNSPLSAYSFQISKFTKAETGEHKKIKYSIITSNSATKYNTPTSNPPKKKRGRKKKMEDEDYEPPKKMRASKERSIAKWVNGIFKDLRIFIVPQNIDKVRLEFLKTRIKERGGSVLELFVVLNVTHVITELKGKKVIQALNINKAEELSEHGIKVTNANWISDSIMYNKLLEIDNYVVHLYGTNSREITINPLQTTSESLKLEKKFDEQDETTTTINNDEVPTKNYNSSSDSGKNFLNTINTPNNDKMVNASQEDPLKEIIAEAKHLTEEGIYSDEEDEDHDQEDSNASARHHESIGATESAEDELTTSHDIVDNTSDNVNNHKNKSASPISKTGEGEIFRLKTIDFSSYQTSFVYMHKHTYGEINENPNKLIIDKLNLMLEHYQKTNKDQWRILAYRKAISVLKNQKKPITSYEEAKKIPGIGDRTAKKIVEIIETGHLKRLDISGEAEPVFTMFTQIHGVGVIQALKWYAQGYRTREELLRNVKLTHAQRAGILCFEDLQERMSRDEVMKIFKFIEDAAHSIDSKLE